MSRTADRGGRKPPGQRNARELVDKCEGLLGQHLADMVRPAVEQTRDRMLDAAEKAKSSQAQARLVASFNLLRRNQDDISARIADGVQRNFAHWRGEEDAVQQPDEHADDELSLSLVAEDELDEELAVDQMVHRLELRFTVELHAIRRRLSVLNGGKPVNDESNPLGPRQVGRILRGATAELPLEAEDKVTLLAAFEELFRERIGDLYGEVNGMLIEAGILPNIRYEVERREPGGGPAAAGEASAPEGEEASTEDAPGPAGAQGTPGVHGAQGHGAPQAPRQQRSPAVQRADNLTREVHAESQMLMSRIGELLERMQGRAKPVPVERQVAPEDMGLALRDLQSQYRPERGETLDAESIKRRLGAVLAEQGKEIAPDQHQTIDVMGMVYDYLRDELAVMDQVKTLFEKLQLPLLRVAISDKGFFEEEHHPARAFFNTLSEAGDLWLGDHPEGSDMLARLTTAVDDVADGDGEDLDRFSERLEDIRKHISLSARKAQLAERRQVQARKGQEKLRIARTHAHEVSSQLIEKYNPPEFARQLIDEAWTDYLALIHLRHGEESEEWQDAVTTIRFVAAGLRGRVPSAMATELRKRLPRLSEDLHNGLCQVGYGGSEADDAVHRVTKAIEWSLDHEHTEAPPEEIAAPIPAPAAREAKPREAPPVSLASLETKLAPGERAALAKLRLLAFGSWLELQDPDSGQWVKRKLSWFSPVTGHCLLTDNLGSAEEQTLVDLAKRMHAGTARSFEVPDKPLLDRALNAVFTRLRRLTGQGGEAISAKA
ncbi:MAG: DUF1631 family protein [Pseudomonadota bacterium]